jgi:recombinational DNA repair protein RecR
MFLRSNPLCNEKNQACTKCSHARIAYGVLEGTQLEFVFQMTINHVVQP